MIKAEIKKNETTYTLEFPSEATLEDAHNRAKEIAEGRELYEGIDQIIDLGTSKKYEHIHVYVEEDPFAVEPPAVENGHSNIRAFYDKLTYLGTTVRVRAVKTTVEGEQHILVYEVNGQPALTTLSKGGLTGLALHVGQVQGGADPIVILQPADLLNEEDAIDYVNDYLKDVLETTNPEHNAAAYTDK